MYNIALFSTEGFNSYNMLVATILQFHLVFSKEIPRSDLATGVYYPL
jgi:hypothetical protein